MRIVLLALALLAGSPALAAQAAPAPLSPADATLAHGAISVGADPELRIPLMIAASSAGTVVGVVAGTLVGAALYRLDRKTGDDFLAGIAMAATGAMLGGAAGSWAGTRIASRGAGNPVLTGLGSLGGVALGAVAGSLVADSTGSALIGFGTAIAIASVLPVVVETATAH